MESWREEELIAFIQNTLCLMAHVTALSFVLLVLYSVKV